MMDNENNRPSVTISQDFIDEVKRVLPRHKELHAALETADRQLVSQLFRKLNEVPLDPVSMVEMLENGREKELLESLRPLAEWRKLQQRWLFFEPDSLRTL
jgi:hypothetical protein